MAIDIEVRTKPHIHQFIQNNFGAPACIPFDHWIYQTFVVSLFTKEQKKYKESGVQQEYSFQSYTCTNRINVPYHVFDESPGFINNTGTVVFNSACDKYIKDIVRLYITMGVLNGMKMTDLYESALEDLSISPDVYSYERVQKDFQRFRDRVDTKFLKKIFRKMSLNMSSIKKPLNNIGLSAENQFLSSLNY